ncbi:MAG TPA: zinc ribbon domain-containing protein [Bacilli bacterium]|nr:zinc ribbon domain-containing protein [Bacilli bacterium]
MICGKCQTVNDSNAKFCVNCGKQIDHLNQKPAGADPVIVAETQQGPVNANVNTEQPVQPVQPVQPTEPNPTVEKAKEIGQSFWNYFLTGLKAPYKSSLSVGAEQADLINGLITLILFSLFIPLTGYRAANHLLGNFGSPPFFDTVVLPFLLFIIFIAIIVAVLFAVSRLMKSEIDFMEVFTRFMTFMIIPAGLATFAFLVSIFNAYNFASLLLVSVFLTMFLASIGSIFSIKETKQNPGGLDVIYVVIIHFVIIGIVLALFGDAILGGMMNELNQFGW